MSRKRLSTSRCQTAYFSDTILVMKKQPKGQAGGMALFQKRGSSYYSDIGKLGYQKMLQNQIEKLKNKK